MLDTQADSGIQRLEALKAANRVRLARAELKRKVAAGEVSAADVVLSCPWEAASMPISDLLRSQRRWGAARCRRLLVSLSLPENKEIGTMTERQRVVLAAMLGGGADPRSERRVASSQRLAVERRRTAVAA